MQFYVITTFPEFFQQPLDTSILGRATKQKEIAVEIIQLRDFAFDEHKTTDDKPYGGSAGMVMKIEPIDAALQSISATNNHRTILLSARGKQFDQTTAERLSRLDSLTLICGHYGDVDQRVAEHLADEEISIGNYVLTGGEPAALVIIDAITRLLPKVLGNQQSLLDESHSPPGSKSAPQYTRPARYRGWQVPEVLLSGNHQAIEEWRKAQRD